MKVAIFTFKPFDTNEVELVVQLPLMTKVKFFSKIGNWLQSIEIFARPSKQLPGKWQLFEYYVETTGELLNLKKEQIEALEYFWNIELANNHLFVHNSNIDLPLIKNIKNKNWKIKRNFLELGLDSSDSVVFQFSIEKQQLKLLKKDSKGKIEFFGFFRKVG